MRFTLAAVLLATFTLAGCGEYDPFEQPRGRSAAPEAVGLAIDPDSLAEPVPASKTDEPAPEQPAPQEATTPAPQAAPQQPPPQDNTVREKADVGAGRKGHYSPGFITTPLSTFWRTKELVAFRVQVPQAVKLYKATHGHFPKTQEEFDREILKPNGVKLPELPPNHRYVYDPEKGELLVEHPG